MSIIVNSGEMAHLVAERIWKETERALCETSPDVYIQTLRNCGALKELLPEVDALFGVDQRADYHPEIDTGIHILMALQQTAKRSSSAAVRFAVLVHDLGKGITPKDILPRHSGHEARGVPLVKAICDRLKVPNEHRKLALVVTEFHLICHKSLELKPTTLLKFLMSIGALKSEKRLNEFLECCIADAGGRKGFEDREYPPAAYLRQAREKLLEVKVKDLANSGLSGSAIGEQLQQRQIQALKQFKNQFQQN
jgi:tRNA nucleotidyltransferase (CCA-adding enzyme)